MKRTSLTKASESILLSVELSAFALTDSCPALPEGYGWVSVPAVKVVTGLIAELDSIKKQ